MIETWTATLTRYLAACERRDAEAIAACFAQDARIVDPSGEQRRVEGIKAYFTAIYAILAELSFKTGPVSWCGASCAVAWEGAACKHDGSRLSYKGIDVFTFEPRGLISELWAFWTPGDLGVSDNLE